MGKGGNRGFTLIELITVLLLSAIIATVAILNWPGIGINLAGEAHQIAGDLRYTQSLAMHRGQPMRINFGPDRYWISNQDDSIREPHPTAGLNDILLDPAVTLGSTHAFLVFDREGAPCIDTLSPCAPLAGDAVIVLDAAGQTRSLRVSPETGRVIVQ